MLFLWSIFQFQQKRKKYFNYVFLDKYRKFHFADVGTVSHVVTHHWD